MRRLLLVLFVLAVCCFPTYAGVVTRYFSTEAAGAGDGTSWANRAALLSAGTWSTVITGFDFVSGSDSLVCYVGPGTYAPTQSLTTAAFSIGVPTSANPIFFHGCDGTGAALTPTNPTWTSDTPVDWDATLPVIATTANIQTINLSHCLIRLLKFTATNAASAVVSVSYTQWCVITNSTSNVSARALGVASIFRGQNSYLECSGATYHAVAYSNNNGFFSLENVRIKGVTGSSGTRYGVYCAAAGPTANVARCTIYGAGGDGIFVSGAAASDAFTHNVVYGVGGNGLNVTRNSAGTKAIAQGMMVVGCGAYGVTTNTTTGLIVAESRFRDNVSGPLNELGNYANFGNLTSAGTDTDEFVNVASGDFRIKRTSSLWAKGYGVSDESSNRFFGRGIRRGIN
jgi:hypothetical protein